MATHSFTLVLGSDTQFTDDVAERVYREVGDDTLFGTCNAAAFIDFEREEDASFRDVVLSAIADVERIGLRVEHVEPDDYVSRAEIAKRIDKSREYVGQLASGATGHADFPPPVCSVSDRSPRWRWSDVAPWLARKGMLAAEEVDRASFVASVNACLEWRRFMEAVGAGDIRQTLLPPAETNVVLLNTETLRGLSAYATSDASETPETSARC
jgi:hypothetical protein